jgi:hypothetical protein
MTRALVLAALLASTSAQAELELVVSTFSWHQERTYPERIEMKAPIAPAPTRRKNIANFGAGLAWQLTPGTKILAGAFHNSAWRSSRYVMATHQVAPHLALAAGYLDGYRRTPIGAAAVVDVGVVRLVAAPGTVSLWFALPLDVAR